MGDIYGNNRDHKEKVMQKEERERINNKNLTIFAR